MNDEVKLRAITNAGYYTDFFLNYRLTASPVLKGLFDTWRAAEKNGDPTPKTRLRALWRTFDSQRPDAATAAPDEETLTPKFTPAAVNAHHALVDATLAALGWLADGDGATGRGDLSVIRAGAEYAVPVSFQKTLPSGLLIVAVDTLFASDPDEVVGSNDAPAGQLLEAANTGTGKAGAVTLYELADLLFNCDTPPRYLLGCSGASLVLLDSDTWHEGRWLGVDLDDALDRRDESATGELAVIAALFGSATLDPADGAANLHDALRDNASREATGVSKELRRGMRRALEALANAVVTDMRMRQHREVLGDRSLPTQLTRECLRYLYRIIVLLYAEAKPELGVLPVDHPEYHEGYGLERLRQLSLVDLHSDAARENNHLQQSLSVLFRAVNDGHQPATQGALFDETKTLGFAPLRSTLFDERSCPLVDRAHVRDDAMQDVLRNLCFTQPRPGKRRDSISYATLGVAQLGAVYEGLMSFTGFIATEDLYEIDRDGDAENGSWVIPTHQAEQHPDDVFLTRTDEHGRTERVLYRKFDFVYRLAGRDRQRAAAFYTSEVLTEFTVRHAIDEFCSANPELSASQLLDTTICEPALGSGAFVNQAVTQLGELYLRLRQAELGETIPPDEYPLQLQRAKAHFAINSAYGVDLNGGGVELAEVSLWLNCMHHGLATPHLDARLRHGNSLVGARRATYTSGQVKAAAWTGKSAAAPNDQHLATVPLGAVDGIHHFLVPGQGWGAAADAVELRGKGGKNPVKGLADEWAASVNAWRKAIHAKPTSAQVARVQALSRRVEAAWAQAAKDAAAFHAATRQAVPGLYGASALPLVSSSRTLATDRFLGQNSPAGRLRTLMDAWCALWMWAPANGSELPSFNQWLDAAELLLGQPDQTDTGSLFTPADLADGTLDSVEQFGRATLEEIHARHPWLAECDRIKVAQAFFHWQLEHAPVFERGGFHITVGNPPWVRLDWDEPACLAEHDPWWGVTDLTKTSDAAKRTRREANLSAPDVVETYCSDRAENEGLAALLSARTREPVLQGLRTNLYMVFMTNSWRRADIMGTVGLLHPESHFADPQAGPLRAAAYARLRRHWQFANEQFLFEDVHHVTEFGVNVYSAARPTEFRQAVNLLDPATLDRSISHDGEGEPPGIQFPEGGWDTRPHLTRIVSVKREVLDSWVRLFDPPGTPTEQSRLLRPLTTADLHALTAFARQESRFVDGVHYWTAGFNEKEQKDDGTIEWKTEIPPRIDQCVLQGPHILNACPMGQQPNPECKNNTDWSAVDLEVLPRGFVPRTNYKIRRLPTAPMGRYPFWEGAPYTARFREAHREFVGSTSIRTMQSCILPPGVGHVHAVISTARANNRETVRWSGLLSSLPIDYLVKTSGASHLTEHVTDALPIPKEHAVLDAALLLRTLRLNCVTEFYASLWSELFDSSSLSDEFVIAADSVASLGGVNSVWGEETPLRVDYDRWLALCEIDAIVALLLGLAEEELVQMYRSQFPVLRKYESQMVFDAHGWQVCGDYHAYGIRQAAWEAELKAAPAVRGEKKVGLWDRIQASRTADAPVDLGPFEPPFRPADREAAMRRAFRAFKERAAV